MASSDVVLLVIAFVGLSTTISLILYFAGVFSGTKKVVDAAGRGEDDSAVVKVGGRRAAAGGLAALRKRKEKRQEQREEQAEEVANHAPDGADAADEQDGEAPTEPRAMTKKELQKELKRQEREEMRRFEEARRDEQRRRAEAKEEAFQKKRDDEAKMEEMRAEEERRLKEAKDKQEQEEFDKWKDMFTVEEQGSKLTEDSEESQTLLQEFVNYIKTHKVILLEDLAAEFNLPTQDAIQRVEALQESNRIMGIIDDRGKFILITEEEMDKVAKFIQRKGRMGIAELAKECNKLIRLEGNKATASTNSLDWLNESEQVEGPDLSI